MSAVRIENITKKVNKKTVLDDVSLSVEENDFFTILGQENSGKSILLQILSFIVKPTSGDAFLFDKSVTRRTTESRKYVSYLPQETALASNLSVYENLELAANIYGYEFDEAKDKIREIMEQYNLSDRADDKVKTLSNGLKKKLSFAICLMNNPKILLLDEPTLDLDVKFRREILNVIDSLKGKITIIIATRNPEFAEVIASNMAIMNNGKIVECGNIESIKQKYDKTNLEDVLLDIAEVN